MLTYIKNIPVEGLVGLLGVIIASISLGWNILNEIRRAPRAHVHAMIANIFQVGNPQYDGKDYLSISVSNVGIRPIRINGIAYDGYKWWFWPWKIKHFMVVPRKLPIYLKDSEEHTEYFEYIPQQFKGLLDHNIQTIYVYDSAGRFHRMPRLKFLDFKRHVARHVKQHLAKSKIEG